MSSKSSWMDRARAAFTGRSGDEAATNVPDAGPGQGVPETEPGPGVPGAGSGPGVLDAGQRPGESGVSRLAALQMDVQERDAEIARLRKEYELLESRSAQGREAAADQSIADLVRRVAPLLSQLVTMQSLAEGGREVRVGDVLKLFAKVEEALAGKGLARIGETGRETTFDPGRHQQMSGLDLTPGDPVTVRFVGYSLDGAILLKAMVSRKDARV